MPAPRKKEIKVRPERQDRAEREIVIVFNSEHVQQVPKLQITGKIPQQIQQLQEGLR